MRRYDEGAARARAVELISGDGRRLLGIAGSPGAGKSTYAERLVSGLAADGYPVALVPMDGFHLAHAVLEEQGLVGVKGAPETFDAAGFVALLRRLREPGGATVWAPRFDRHLEDPIAGAIGVPPEVRLVVTEGNYLLLDQGPWAVIASLLDECWFLDVDPEVRRDRLTARHVRHGRSPVDALARTDGSDEANARLIDATRTRATALVICANR